MQKNSTMNEKDTSEVFFESMKQAVSLCRDMVKAQPLRHVYWASIANSLDGMRVTLEKAYQGKALTRQEVLATTDAYAKTLGENKVSH
jgi:hypothetical protein